MMNAKSISKLSSRHRREQRIYDRIASKNKPRKISSRNFPLPGREHADFLPEFFRRIGNVRGKRIVELGSGPGELAVHLALRGANVVGIELSAAFLKIARANVRENGAKTIRFVSGVAEKIPLPDASVDLVIGNQVFHHFEIERAAAEVARILRPGGRMVLAEPIGFSPAIERIKSATKRLLRRADHRHTPDEKILDHADFAKLKKPFASCRWHGFQLFATRIVRVVPMSDPIFATVLRIDATILRTFPFFRHFARIAVIECQKKG